MIDDYYSVRPFSSGSRKAPDILDHYLENEGYYRKHTARDSSSLFRVISEQIFDVQMFHGKVRQDCITFMEAHENDYSNEVDKHYYNYVSNLKKPRTSGTLLELRILARMYKKNVILFEPKTKGTLYVSNDDYDNKNPFLVFYSDKDKHFDSIFTLDYVENLANSQAVAYEILYSGVYQLPDIEFATERMLHDQFQNNPSSLPEDSNKYLTATGKICEFDSHYKTKCVLKDPKTCHFHNRRNFEEIVGETINIVTTLYDPNDPSKVRYYKPIEGFLHDKKRSCVRQLLDEGITPYPYKVAKALDVNIYRNTEFEQWSEKRREQRLKWLEENELSFKMLPDEKGSIFNEEYPEQKEVYIKDLRSFHGLDRFLRTHVSTDAEYMKKHEDFYESKTNYNYKLSDIEMKNKFYSLNDDLRKSYKTYDNGPGFNESYKLSLNELCKLNSVYGNDHLCPRTPYESIIMPANVYRGGYKGKRGRGGSSSHQNGSGIFNVTYSVDTVANSPNEQEQQQQQHEAQYPVPPPPPPPQGYLESQYNYGPTDNVIPSVLPQYYSATPWNESFNTTGYYHQQNIQAPQPQQFPPQYMTFGHPQMFANPQNQQHYTYVSPMTNISVPPPPIYSTNNGFATDTLIRPIDLNSTLINYNAKNSYDINGKDLPINDIATLQFFFNLGIDYFKSSGIRMNAYSSAPNQQFVPNAPENIDSIGAAKPVNDKQNDVKNEEFGNSSAQQNSGSAYGRSNPNFNQINNGTKRRTYNQSYRVFNSNAKRTDVKFNSNVKNLHKNEQVIKNMQQQNVSEAVTSVVNTPVTMTSNTGTNPVTATTLFSQMPTNVNEQPQLQYGAVQQFDLQQNQFCPRPTYPMYHDGSEYMQQQQVMHFPYVYYPPQTQQQHLQGAQLEYFPSFMEASNISNDSGLVFDNSNYHHPQYFYSSYQNQSYANTPIPQVYYHQQVPPSLPHAVNSNDTSYLQVQPNTMAAPNVATMMSNMKISSPTNQNTSP